MTTATSDDEAAAAVFPCKRSSVLLQRLSIAGSALYYFFIILIIIQIERHKYTSIKIRSHNFMYLCDYYYNFESLHNKKMHFSIYSLHANTKKAV